MEVGTLAQYSVTGKGLEWIHLEKNRDRLFHYTEQPVIFSPATRPVKGWVYDFDL